MTAEVEKPERAPRLPEAGLGDLGAKLMLILLCVIWGTTWPLMKIALVEIPPLSMRTVTPALGAATLYAACLFRGTSFHIPNAKSRVHIAVAAVLNIVGFTVLGSFAQMFAATARVAILAYTMPIWAVLLAWPFLGERPTGMKLVALCLCAGGLAVLIYPLTGGDFPLGIVLAVATGVSWAAGTVYMKWARIDGDPMAVACWQLVVSTLVIFALALVFDGGVDFSRAHAPALWATLFTGIAGNGIAYGLWFAIIGRLTATTASLGVLGSPVVGVIASVLILGERPTAADMIGFALIFAASACVLLTPGSPTPKEAAATP